MPAKLNKTQVLGLVFAQHPHWGAERANALADAYMAEQAAEPASGPVESPEDSLRRQIADAGNTTPWNASTPRPLQPLSARAVDLGGRIIPGGPLDPNRPAVEALDTEALRRAMDTPEMRSQWGLAPRDQALAAEEEAHRAKRHALGQRD
jgi:hypothetical protein